MTSRTRARVGFAAVILTLITFAPAHAAPSVAGRPGPDVGPARSPATLFQVAWQAAADWLGPVIGIVFAADGEPPPDDPFGGSGGDPGSGNGVVDPNGGSGGSGTGGGGT